MQTEVYDNIALLRNYPTSTAISTKESYLKTICAFLHTIPLAGVYVFCFPTIYFPIYRSQMLILSLTSTFASLISTVPSLLSISPISYPSWPRIT